MNNYFKNLIGISALILVIHFCVKDSNTTKQNNNYVPVSQPISETTFEVAEPVFSFNEVVVTPTPTSVIVEASVPTPVPLPTVVDTTEVVSTPTPYVPTEQEIQAQAKYQQDLLVYANEDLYNTLVKARDSYSKFYGNGEASSQMRNLEIQMSQYDADFVDSNLHTMYDLINRYVSSYEAGKYDDCINIGSKLYDMGNRYLDKNTLYQILVSNQLPEEYQGTVDFKNRGNSIYDMYGNIVLDNGREINIIGGTDDLVSAMEVSNDDYTRMQDMAKWIKKIPSVLLSHYTTFRDNFADLDVGYIWNQTKVERIARNEWNVIKKNGQDMYGFDMNNVTIHFSEENNSYVYEDYDGNQYGLVNYDDNAKIDYLYDLEDAIVSGEGDAYYLDNAIHNMISDQQNRQYNK